MVFTASKYLNVGPQRFFCKYVKCGILLPSLFHLQIEVLPEIIDAVEGKIEVFLDGGIRKGTDVLKALALGAKAVFVGRPVIWGLAYQVI